MDKYVETERSERSEIVALAVLGRSEGTGDRTEVVDGLS
jgi:hypothetical protein